MHYGNKINNVFCLETKFTDKYNILGFQCHPTEDSPRLFKASSKLAYLDINGLPTDFIRMSSFEVRKLLHVLRSCFIRLLKPLCPFYIWKQVQTRKVI